MGCNDIVEVAHMLDATQLSCVSTLVHMVDATQLSCVSTFVHMVDATQLPCVSTLVHMGDATPLSCVSTLVSTLVHMVEIPRNGGAGNKQVKTCSESLGKLSHGCDCQGN